MSKKSLKPKPNHKKNFSATEVGVLLEESRSNFKVLAEGQEQLRQKLDVTYDQVVRNFERISLLEIAVKNSATKKDIANMATKDDIKVLAAKIEALTESINNLAKTKLDREDFIRLEGRLNTLEAKVASLSS
ncbi:MAG: hypothetical protein JW714_01535 [Candidatus Omnitrophica bacterium]|nr:hypothetical protein [Candidatus Omnitrophota bacterium]